MTGLVGRERVRIRGLRTVYVVTQVDSKSGSVHIEPERPTVAVPDRWIHQNWLEPA